VDFIPTGIFRHFLEQIDLGDFHRICVSYFLDFYAIRIFHNFVCILYIFVLDEIESRDHQVENLLKRRVYKHEYFVSQTSSAHLHHVTIDQDDRAASNKKEIILIRFSGGL